MTYCNPINAWLMEHCLICSSVNHVFVYTEEAQAWECYHCHTRHWIDDYAEDTYIIENNISEDEANQDLGCSESAVKCLYGNYERRE